MAFVEVATTDVDVDSPAKQSRLRELRENIDIARIRFLFFEWTQQSTVDTAYGGQIVVDCKVPLPPINTSPKDIRRVFSPSQVRRETS